MSRYKKIVLLKDTKEDKSTKRFYDLLLSKLREKELVDSIQVVRAADIGLYDKGVVFKIFPENIVYAHVKEEDIDSIIDKTLIKNKIIEDLVFKPQDKQLRIVLRNCGIVDPENIDDYICQDGYQAFKKVLLKKSQDYVIEEMKISGLRGRGGGGFPTWMKWSFAKGVSSDQKFVICNADEGDPGAYMDRSVLEGDPHSVLEGMMISGYAIGATKGFLYIRAEYPLAIKRIDIAIKQAREYGLLGENILGSGFNFDLEIRLGAGAFVCGEETALIASIEGKRGCPKPRPPYPSIKGLWDKPTVINNVETLANIPIILFKGGQWFSSIGTEKSKGTKVFALTGKVKNSGLVEVPMGTTLREIVFDIGGGVFEDKKIKAIQTGGPSGGVIPVDYFDTPVEYESLQKLGSIMGSGGMIVMDETDCMIDIAKFYLGFCVEESCGKCAPCRIGGTQLLGLLTKISEGKGELDDLRKLKVISLGMQKASLCGLGQTAANPVLSTIKFFNEEYLLHIKEKRCPAGKCSNLFSYTIIEEKCKRCGLCLRNCPVGAITGDKNQGYVIDQEKCIQCGRCFEVCRFLAIRR
ncbi:MAG: NADH-quinone oxidoreductase subunit NuoF [Candidatus Omnitrophica bacterium]|nr:NADH-quinone oxidoreductase subunit NuoF [Candidatus Omnitrophota bacterium]